MTFQELWRDAQREAREKSLQAHMEGRTPASSKLPQDRRSRTRARAWGMAKAWYRDIPREGDSALRNCCTYLSMAAQLDIEEESS